MPSDDLTGIAAETMIERAKSVIVVTWRVDEDQAAQILLDAAGKADIPQRLAADQVMAALVTDRALAADPAESSLQESLVRALDAVRPIARLQVPGSLPAPPAGHAA